MSHALFHLILTTAQRGGDTLSQLPLPYSGANRGQGRSSHSPQITQLLDGRRGDWSAPGTLTGPSQELPEPQMQLGPPSHGQQPSRLPRPGPGRGGTRSPCSCQDWGLERRLLQSIGPPPHEDCDGRSPERTDKGRADTGRGAFRTCHGARSRTVGSSAFPTGLSPVPVTPRTAHIASGTVAFCQALMRT